MKKISLLCLFLTAFVFANAQQFKLSFNQSVVNTSNEFHGECDLTMNNGNSLIGTIKWSVIKVDKSLANYYANKMNATAIEYFSGRYDPESKIFTFSGNNKNDPSGIIDLDVYQISLLGNMEVQGKTRGTGKWDGIVKGKYSVVEVPAASSTVSHVIENSTGSNSTAIKIPGTGKESPEAQKYRDLIEKYLFNDLTGGFYNVAYVPGSIGDVTVVTRSKTGTPTRVSAGFSFKNRENTVGKTTVDVMYENDLAYYMIYGIKRWKIKEPFSGEVLSMDKRKRIFELQELYDKTAEEKLALINRKKYLEVVRLFKSKYPGNDSKKYLAVVSYDERVKKTGTVKSTAPGYNGNGELVDYSIDKDVNYYEDEKRKGFKNIGKKSIVIMGIKREQLVGGEWHYTDISLTLKPGEMIYRDDIQQFYNPVDDNFTEEFFFDIK